LAGPIHGFVSHRSLIWELSKREVLGRYRGASFGLAWSIISPFMMLGVYAFAFGTVMKSRWPQEAGGDHSYAIILFVGLVLHGFLAECITRAPSLIVANPNFVKKVVFPLEVLPWSMLLSALFHTFMNLLVLAFLMLVLERHLPPSILYFPLILLPFALIVLGASWMLASLGVYLRDITQVMPVVATALLFLSSAIVPVSILPLPLQRLFHLNPLTFFIDQARRAVLAGLPPDFGALAIAAVAGLVFAWLGHAWFKATQRGFADVL
jgi:lipopolysaccharide transport system permease protein